MSSLTQTQPIPTKPSESPTSVKLDIVHPSLLPDLWPMIEPLIKSICDSTNGRMIISDARQFIEEKDILLWCAFESKIEAIALTEIRNYKQRRMLVILGVTGTNKEKWQPFMPRVEEYAKSVGCDGIEAIARKGWCKLLEPQGFKASHVFIEKMFAS